MSPTPLGLPIVDDTTQIAPLQALLNNISTALDAALTIQNVTIAGLQSGSNFHTGTAAERAAFKTAAPVGSAWMDTDASKLLYVKVSTEWVPFPFGADGTFATAGGGELESVSFIRRDMGKVVDFTISCSRSGWTTGGVTTLGTFPSGFRPVDTLPVCVALNGATAPSVRFGQLTTGGALEVHTSPTNGQSWTATVTGRFKVA